MVGYNFTEKTLSTKTERPLKKFHFPLFRKSWLNFGSSLRFVVLQQELCPKIYCFLLASMASAN